MKSIIIRIMIQWYIIIGTLIFVLNLSIGPITPGLALTRAILWPVWIATGVPEGSHMRIGDQYD